MKKLTHVVSFSGGRTSAYLVWLMERARKEFGWDVKYVFCDTGVEHPATYKFIRDIIKFWNIDLIILRAVVNPILGQGNSYQQFEHRDLMNSAVMPPFEPFMSMMIKYGTPTALGPYCSERMKKDVTEAYCKDHFGKDNFVTWLGMRTDEPARLKPKKGIKYLADLIDIEKQDVLEWWRHQPFDLECEEWEGNCLLCVKKSSAKIALAARQNPHFYRMWKYHLEQKTVREKEGYDKLVMYRGRLSLDGIVQLYEGRTQADIFSRMKCQKRFETGSCTESCEAFKLEGEEINFNVVNQQVYKDFEIELENLQDQLELFAA
ncbi:phosphoadenosine phosphosulfate reductase domain-containing protein [Vibrio sp. 10N]|uniref:phosphoadenosine phosphosulfate reductase domain-containing protein n=1 Tax=Vibrio sp. 10N TaxID=3058938 RepID=UPI002813E725|nr:phosphoadenosine phosphosulfate reductase family protein [Vibrio sp. 10N]